MLPRLQLAVTYVRTWYTQFESFETKYLYKIIHDMYYY